MAYTIYKSDGSPVTVNDNSISIEFYDTTGGSTGLGSGIRLVGRNAIDYGVPIAQNFLQMTENFASSGTSRPDGTAALQGMIWFNKTINSLFLKTGTGNLSTDWNRLPRVNPSLTPQDGDIQVTGSTASIYANGTWGVIPTGLSLPVSISNGGTGETSAQAARNALMPSQSGNSGRFLTTDGTNMTWATVAAGGVLFVSGTTNRITISGSPSTPAVDIASTYSGQTSITTLGTITTGTWNGSPIAIANGGTGQTTANSALNALLPSQGTNAGRFLATDGTNTSWVAVAPGGVTSVTATAPVNSTGGSTPQISLAATYGDTLNPYGSKTANTVLAAPSGSSGSPAFRSLGFADVSNFCSSTGVTANTVVSRGPSGEVEVGAFTAATGTFSGTLITNSTTASTSTTTGALRSAGGLGVAGTIWCAQLNSTGDITAFATSDSRLKANIELIPDALSKVLSISGITYSWNDKASEVYGKDMSTRETGVIAQEIIEVLPEAVTIREEGYMAVRYEKIIPLLIEAIKDLKSEVEDLRNLIKG